MNFKVLAPVIVCDSRKVKDPNKELNNPELNVFSMYDKIIYLQSSLLLNPSRVECKHELNLKIYILVQLRS